MWSRGVRAPARCAEQQPRLSALARHGRAETPVLAERSGYVGRGIRVFCHQRRHDRGICCTTFSRPWTRGSESTTLPIVQVPEGWLKENDWVQMKSSRSETVA